MGRSDSADFAGFDGLVVNFVIMVASEEWKKIAQ
jgi:hypothetical protein